jgi:hypothetical protein
VSKLYNSSSVVNVMGSSVVASGKSNSHLFCLMSPYCCLKQNLSRIKQIAVKESFLRIRKFAWNKEGHLLNSPYSCLDSYLNCLVQCLGGGLGMLVRKLSRN